MYIICTRRNARWLLQPTRAVLFKGMPGVVSHLSKMIVDDLGLDRCRLRWEVYFEFISFHPFALTDSFSRQFKNVLDAALLNLKQQVEQL